MRILLVDDHFESRWAIAGWLIAFLKGVAVESAASSDEALAVLDQRHAEIILASHTMLQEEGLDGLGLARLLKARPDSPTVVMLTEKSDPRFEEACAAAGADYWLEKRHLQARLLIFLKERFPAIVARRAII
jgi:CheY-like chemotaxis protein